VLLLAAANIYSRAWIFAAGLVLGFSMFAEGEAKFDVEDGFRSAVDVLQKLARHSPQAEHYFEILGNFSEAIRKHQQQRASERRRDSSHYVNQILVIDVPDDPAGTQDAGESSESAVDEAGLANLANWYPIDSSLPSLHPEGLDADWGVFAMQIADNSLFDDEMFSRAFND
jgi:hypothetical protein